MEIDKAPFPDFLVVGAAKCGTTSLYHYLKQHQQVYMSPIKEPNHFSTDIKPAEFSPEYKLHEKVKNLNVSEYVRSDMKKEVWGAYVQDEEEYKMLFRFAGDSKAIGEISNSYLYSDVAAANIFKKYPAMKIIMILRQPAERAWSHYLANVRDGKTTLAFREELRIDASKKEKGWGKSHLYHELGLYSEQVKRYLDLFPAEQLKIYLYDDLRHDREKLVRSLFEFLGITINAPIDFHQRYNEARIPKSPALVHLLTRMGIKRKLLHAFPEKWQGSVKSAFFSSTPAPRLSKQDKQALTHFYKEDIQKLSVLLNRDLSMWLHAD